jgi:chemotaxis methyl-accepting protein methylase
MDTFSTKEISDNELNKNMKPMDDEKILFVLSHYFEQFKEHPTVSKEMKENVELTKKNLLEKVIGFKSKNGD